MKILIALFSFVFFSCASFGLWADTSPSAGSPTAADVQQLISINSADVATLAQLKGVGIKKAEAIVAWREANGEFKAIEQLMDVKGIGEATFEANRDKLSL